ncbi:MAG: hypothetical protein AMQ74_01937 [Candidatus Methanofastidiosum methylothiophilum]|uniref:Uncharacterized protein n=1 Tax=Candidatus Methanofastidiosum methylothiophilum TaxID=1705564 RepID=A0A150III8_9EURY|nr:MAG: hypothetical protein AMQ74_01937 [Candidatus Methanofastidiosum methylthiophilus]
MSIISTKNAAHKKVITIKIIIVILTNIPSIFDSKLLDLIQLTGPISVLNPIVNPTSNQTDRKYIIFRNVSLNIISLEYIFILLCYYILL